MFTVLPPRVYNALQRFANGDNSGLYRAILDAYEPFKGQPVLEIGCGTGIMAKIFPPGVYTGADTDRTRIEKARATVPGQEFLWADVCDFDPEFLSGFPFVFCHAVIHHIPDEGVMRLLNTLANAAVVGKREVDFLVLEPTLAPVWKNPPGWVLAKLDRGKWVRSHEANLRLFGPAVKEFKTSPPRLRWPVTGASYRLRFLADVSSPDT